MASTIWKGHLTFGLISVPIKLYAAARSESVSFNQLHGPCKSRIKQQTFCPVHEQVVERKDLIKGYEVEAGRWVIIEEADLEKVTPASGKTLEIMEFVKLDEVDPFYYNTSYYLVPETAGEKAYYLLTKALDKSGYVGIGKISMHQREHTVIIRPAMDGMMLHTIYYSDEVRKNEEYGHPDKVTVVDKEMELAEMFIQSLSTTFEPERYKDAYRENLLAMISAKAAGAEVPAAAQAVQPPVVDLMAALKASLEKTRPNGEASAAEVGRKKPPARIQGADTQSSDVSAAS